MPAEPGDTAPVRGRLRRRPRYVRFIVSGGAAGLAVGLVVGLARAGLVEQPAVLMFYLAVLLTGLGAMTGAGFAVLVESRQSSRRAGPEVDDT